MLNISYNIIILELFIFFHYNHVTMIMTYVTHHMTVCDSCDHDVTSNPNPK